MLFYFSLLDGAPLSELSWSSSLVVVAVSFSGLFTFIFLMLACLCCKKGDIGFKEFENTDGDEYTGDLSTLASPASQNGPEVYILPLTEVSLPVSKQPGRSVQLLKSKDLARHSLLYLKEIGHGWFGKVLLGEVNAGLSTTQVVVKELKASASVQDQMQFLEETQPYRALQHPNLLQCLAQCSEVTPYLLVMEFCALGDLKGYLRSFQAADSMTPDPLTLQRMACEIASGLLHLHKYNYIHSDLALRNCLLTAEVTVKIGDYGLSHNKYKDDYFVTADQLWVPLRWIAPELIDEVHGNLLVVDQTKPSNIWSLGVTIWELFELGNQPYKYYSDRQVLTYAIKEQQLKLPKPVLKLPLAERWYEVMQFCWLQPDQRPTAEEVHLLLSYLCAKGASEAEEEFEKRWNSLRPNSSNSATHTRNASAVDLPSSSSSSFPLLEQFSGGDSFHAEAGDDILTVTETSHGLNFEYKWEQAHSEHASLTLGVSPSYYDSKHSMPHTPDVVPVLSTHSPSVSSEYYIRIEESNECNIDLDYTISFWPGESHKTNTYDSDNSPTISLTMEPLLGQLSTTSPLEPWESGEYYSYKDRERDQSYYYERSSSDGADAYLLEDNSEPHIESWGSRSLRQALGELEDPLGASPSFSVPRVGFSEDDTFTRAKCWSSNSSANNNSLNFAKCSGQDVYEGYAEFHFMTPSNELTEPCPVDETKQPVDPGLVGDSCETDGKTEDNASKELKQANSIKSPLSEESLNETSLHTNTEMPSESSKTTDSGLEKDNSSVSLDENDKYSDDITDVTSGIFTDFPDTVDATPAFKSLQKQVGTPDSMESLDMPSICSGEVFSPTNFHSTSQPKALDSGYDTENNESPEFVLKEPHEPRDSESFTQPLGKSAVSGEIGYEDTGNGAGINSVMLLSSCCTPEIELRGLTDKNPYRDSAYFSDYDNESENAVKSQGMCSKRNSNSGSVTEITTVNDGIEAELIIVPSLSLSQSTSKDVTCLTKELSSDEVLAKDIEILVEKPESTSKFIPEVNPGSLDEALSSSEKATVESFGTEYHLRMETRVSPADGEEADEEDGDSDDSEESDEELCCYNIQEQSEESEEEFPTVPVVISDSSDAQNLRSLLKMPTLLSESLCEELDRKKKAVSFFDDVTVYLFDQESPTRELGEQSFPQGAEASGHCSGTGISSQDRITASDDSSDGNISEESGGFEWDDDFPLMPVKSSVIASLGPVNTEPSLITNYSRFTVSTPTASRFSITHVSDSDIDSVGGEHEKMYIHYCKTERKFC
uniref:non-specific serine/threonine protein kinase n=1 Tax=Erpetoichthys calabaricus TaxID=27687 RepID=A0A8C4T8H9_ERPCA